MKKRAKKDQPPEDLGADWGCAFKDLKIDIPEPPPPPVAEKAEKSKVPLSREDQELLRAFSAGSEIDGVANSQTKISSSAYRPSLRFALQRKGKGGKTVTYVHGLKKLSIAEQMEICSDIRVALGIGARFIDGLLELQGDQRERAEKWFTEKKFPTL